MWLLSFSNVICLFSVLKFPRIIFTVAKYIKFNFHRFSDIMNNINITFSKYSFIVNLLFILC